MHGQAEKIVAKVFTNLANAFTIRDMPKKGTTTVIAVRAPDDLAEAIRQEATRRKMSVNELLNLRLAADFRVGSRATEGEE